jgi:hypothetical protein
MKTLRINPFNLRPQVKRLTHRPKHVIIPAELPEALGNKFVAMQGSLDYMATNYGINFKFIHWPFKLEDRELSIDKVTCKGKNNTFETELIHTDRDDEADIAKNVYMTVSNVMKSEKLQSYNNLYGVKVQDIPDILKPTLKIYSGILEYYAKKYDGMTFTVTGINGENSIVNKNPPKIVIGCNYNSKSASVSISKVDHAAHTSSENAFYTDWGYNLKDFYEDKKYEDIYKMVRSVLEPNDSQSQEVDSKPLQ